MLHVPINLLLLAAKQVPCHTKKKKNLSLTKNILKNFLEKVPENGPAGRKKDRTGVTGLGRKTREEIVKWNQMRALRFHTGGRHQTSLASLQGYHHN